MPRLRQGAANDDVQPPSQSTTTTTTRGEQEPPLRDAIAKLLALGAFKVLLIVLTTEMFVALKIAYSKPSFWRSGYMQATAYPRCVLFETITAATGFIVAMLINIGSGACLGWRRWRRRQHLESSQVRCFPLLCRGPAVPLMQSCLL